MISNLYLRSASASKPLRIGVMLDSLDVPRWVARVLDDVTRCEFAAIRLLVLHREPAPAPEAVRPGLASRLWRVATSSRHRRGVLFWRYTLLDAARQTLTPDPFETVSLGERLRDVERLEVTPISKGSSHYFAPAAIEELRARDLDVLLRFGFNILRGEVLHAARYGIWSFHHGDNDDYRGGPAHFWELVEGNPISGVMLQVLTEELDAGRVLCKLLFGTEPGLSLQRNRWGPYWGSTHLVIRKLHELHEQGWEQVQRKMVPRAPYRGRRRTYRAPTNGELVRWLGPKIAKKCLTAPFRKRQVSQWRIGLRANGANGATVHGSAGEGPQRGDLQGFRWLDAPRGRFWADPFLVEQDGCPWLFFEEFSHGEQRGVIKVARVLEDCTIDGVRDCLSRPYHLSFPNVFRHDGEMFMIPESVENGTVELYRATGFPYEWRLEKVLFRGNVVDTSPWFDGQRWWFFAGMAEPVGHTVVGMLFWSESLTGTWRMHPASPIAQDVRVARNAGPIFTSNGKLFRPSQNCAGMYGRSMSLQEIVQLTPEQYVERRALTVEPTPGSGFSGLHTYSFAGVFEAIDARRWEPATRHLQTR
jgi:hypothetical protein